MSRYAVGIGMRPGVRSDAVVALVGAVLAENGLDPADAVFATLTSRAAEPGLRDAVRRIVPGGVRVDRGRPGPAAELVVGWAPEELADEPVPHPDRRVADAVGTPSVAEAAALRTARTFPDVTGAGLVVPKVVGDGVTVAVARPVDP